MKANKGLRLNKGLLTELNILNTAKALFYEKGFAKTTVKEICHKTDVKLGTFTYYFKTKEDLVSNIYAEFLMKTYTYATYLENRKMNSLEKNIFANFIYYHLIFSNDKNRKFHYDVLNKYSIIAFLSDNLKRIYKNIVRDFNLDIDEKELERILMSDLGIRRELTLAYIEKDKFDDPLDLAATINLMLARLFTIDEEKTLEYFQKAHEFMAKHDFSRIKFLV